MYRVPTIYTCTRLKWPHKIYKNNTENSVAKRRMDYIRIIPQTDNIRLIRKRYKTKLKRHKKPHIYIILRTKHILHSSIPGEIKALKFLPIPHSTPMTTILIAYVTKVNESINYKLLIELNDKITIIKAALLYSNL